MEKIFMYIILVLFALLIIVPFAFNHINPYVSIAFGLFILYILIKILKTK